MFRRWLEQARIRWQIASFKRDHLIKGRSILVNCPIGNPEVPEMLHRAEGVSVGFPGCLLESLHLSLGLN